VLYFSLLAGTALILSYYLINAILDHSKKSKSNNQRTNKSPYIISVVGTKMTLDSVNSKTSDPPTPESSLVSTPTPESEIDTTSTPESGIDTKTKSESEIDTTSIPESDLNLTPRATPQVNSSFESTIPDLDLTPRAPVQVNSSFESIVKEVVRLFDKEIQEKKINEANIISAMDSCEL
jgi:hypothetical protein